MVTFNIGDTVKKNDKNNKEEELLLIIVDIFIIKGGDFHDGYTITKHAKLSDNTFYELSYDNNMANIHITYFTLTKITS
jgi:hypothetical protein